MQSLKGYYLLAVPELMDPNFYQSVVLVVQHDAQGALGVILNRPIKTTVLEAWEQISDQPCKFHGHLYIGGPCEGPMIVLHQNDTVGQLEVLPGAGKSSMEEGAGSGGGKGIFFTTEADQITHLITQDSGRMKCIVGYAGWTAGQLEKELAEEGWIVGPATAEGVLNTPSDAWARLYKQFSDAMRYPNMKPELLPPDPMSN